MTAIELRGICKRFNQVVAAEQLNLQIDSGWRVVILGPSGAGKTTLLRLVAGLEQPDSGQILLAGRDVSRTPPAQRNVALLSQDYALYPQLSVEKNLQASLACSGLSTEACQQRITEILECLGIEELRKRLPASLSGGQAQRVAFARALVRKPRLLLLDEPLSQVDPLLRRECRALIRRVSEQFGITMLLVTHDPMDAMLLATHIAIMRHGRIEQFDTPSQVYSQPSSRIAAELLSPFGINWLPLADIEFNADIISGTAPLHASKLLGIRAEHVLLSRHPTGATDEPGIQIRAEINELCFVGFAHLARASIYEHELRILDPRLELELGPATFFVAQANCIWL